MNTKPGTTGAGGPRADCTADADGRITFTLEAPATAARLLLRLRPKKGQPEKVLHTLDLEPAADGRLRAVLEHEPVLAEGRWDMYLIPEPGAPRRRLRPGLRDLRALVDGHRRDRPSPVAVRIPYATKDGYLATRAWLRTAHAEVAGIDVTDRTMTVRARLHGTSFSGGATVRLRLRGGGGTVRTLVPRVEDDGRGFSFTVEYGELVADDAGNRVWDLSVRAGSAEGTAPVRIGRLLDDVADRKEVFVFPEAVVGGAVVRPYYTVDNDLSVLADRT
ncbi:transferase [Streptomyces ferrugineus]|uniref:Transferase n=1 Tax=Streptomyces ferrugineus TaxID=1413221 RepID=A0A7M2SXQ4_9ACTN|nr:transferase [Streptomyces ferrugineus]QOV40689.1 transferase [Streptomyces ferrugineus]